MLPPKSNFSEWYHEIIEQAKIMDIRYPVKGLYVWLPYGYKLRNLVYRKLKEIMDRDHEEVYFPALIPETELRKEGKHIKGFENEVYWITHGGLDELDIKLALRPTSETAIYPMFKVWIRSHADLPLRIYQVVNVFRYETKHTRPLIRLREITSFKEAHTAHRDYKEAEQNVNLAIQLYKEFYDSLAIPYLVIKRPEWDKFPGADYTIAFDTVMPDGKTMQIGTVHHLADNFAKTFDIKYETINGDHAYVHQTCYGISERCIAALISIHGDDLGLVLPFSFAPFQFVIIPILYKGKEREVMDFAREVFERVKKMGYRAILDDSDERPGSKYYKWELFGVPVRLEIGPREVENKEVVISFRDERVKRKIKVEELSRENVERWASEMFERMRSRAYRSMFEKVKFFDRVDEIAEYMGSGLALFYLCNRTECGEELEDYIKAGVLGELVEMPEFVNVSEKGRCVICGGEGRISAAAKSY